MPSTPTVVPSYWSASDAPLILINSATCLRGRKAGGHRGLPDYSDFVLGGAALAAHILRSRSQGRRLAIRRSADELFRRAWDVNGWPIGEGRDGLLFACLLAIFSLMRNGGQCPVGRVASTATLPEPQRPLAISAPRASTMTCRVSCAWAGEDCGPQFGLHKASRHEIRTRRPLTMLRLRIGIMLARGTLPGTL